MPNNQRPTIDRALVAGAWGSGLLLLVSLLVAGYLSLKPRQEGQLTPQEQSQVERALRRLEINPADQSAAITAADAFLTEGRIKEAERVLLRALERRDPSAPPSIPLLVTLGTLYAEQQNPSRAENYFRRAISARKQWEFRRVDRYLAEAEYQLGLIEAAKQRCRAAIRHFQAALAITSSDADAYFQLGKCQLVLRLPRAALVSLQSAVRLAPDYTEAYERIGATYQMLGNPYEAIEAYNRAGVSPPPDIMMTVSQPRSDDAEKAEH